MSNPDDWSTNARDWITVLDADNWIIYLSNDQTISVSRGDFGVEVHHVDPVTGVVSEFDGTPFPYRAGAMEAVRRWITASGLEMSPTEAQRQAAWHATGTDAPGAARGANWDHSYRAKHQQAPQAKPVSVAPLDIAASLNAMLAPVIDDYEETPPIRYWHHPESDSYFKTDPGMVPSEPCDELTEAEFIAAQLNAMLKP